MAEQSWLAQALSWDALPLVFAADHILILGILGLRGLEVGGQQQLCVGLGQEGFWQKCSQHSVRRVAVCCGACGKQAGVGPL